MELNLRKPCVECPFGQDSLPGWLGPWNPEQILNVIEHEQFPCHLTIPEELPDPLDYNIEGLEGCAGAAIFLNHCVTLSRAKETAEHQALIKANRADVNANTFQTREAFFEHHNQYRL